MDIPFTADQFFRVFAAYNTAWWPAQVVLTGMALGAVALVFVPRRWSGAAVSAILSVLWAWIALAYHLAFFTTISPPAYAFAAISMGGAVAFFWQGVVRRKLEFQWVLEVRTMAGLCLVVFGLLGYPLWAWVAGHRYPAFATFGLPCPTTIFTIGLMAFAVAPYPRSPLVVPVLWCFIGAQAAFLLDVPQDLGLVVAGFVGIALLTTAKRGARNIPARLHIEGTVPP
jgi:hypothetical protein